MQMKLRQNKKLLFVVILCLVVLIVMIAWLTTLLIQQNAFKRRVQQLKEMINTNSFDIERYREELDYRNSWEFCIQWAKENGLLTQNELLWILDNLGD